MAAPVSREEAGALTRYIQTLLNNQLKSICSLNGIKSTGVKSELQGRLREIIVQCFESRDWSRYRQLERSVTSVCGQLPSPWPPCSQASDNRNPAHSVSQTHGYLPPQPQVTGAAGMPPMRQAHRGPVSSLTFKRSPFYEPVHLIGTVITLHTMPHHKNSITFTVPGRYLAQCKEDDSYRIMLFAAKGTNGPQDIAFPQQADVRVDHSEVKGLNMRGLKNKPGTTRPADLTSALLAKGTYDKPAEFIYALTNEPYYLAPYLCKTTSVEQLVARIATGNRISKDSVLREFERKCQQRAQDPDEIIATSQVLSLKCPLSWQRLKTPCRSMSCTHNQCFDATFYLHLQMQGPQWLCPICDKSAPFDQLAVDEYVKDILLRTSPSVEQVTIEPDGKWRVPGADPNPNSDRKRKAPADDDIDEIVISGSNVVGKTPTSTAAPRLPIVTTSRPPASGVMPGSASTPTPTPTSTPTSGKRPAVQSAVIDLTLSDEEDNEPIARPAKRQQFGR